MKSEERGAPPGGGGGCVQENEHGIHPDGKDTHLDAVLFACPDKSHLSQFPLPPRAASYSLNAGCFAVLESSSALMTVSARVLYVAVLRWGTAVEETVE